MYSKEVEDLLKSKKAAVGDKLEITSGKESYIGLLMPRIGLGDPSNIVIKLDNGYNIGVKFEKGINLKVLQRGKFKPFKAIENRKIDFKKDSKKPSVSVLGCGGTIASRVEYTTGAVTAAFSPQDLIVTFPNLKDMVNVDGRKLFDLMSEDMTSQHWSIIAEEVAKEIKKNKDGIILMHGTDTMHYTSAALSFALQNLPVPVVLVGAQRSSDRGSSDNHVNLVSSVLATTKSNISEVTVCMHGSSSDDFCFVHQGTKVRKMHTSRRDTFRSINALPYAKVWFENQKIEYLRNDFRKVDKKRKLELSADFNHNVGLIYIHPGIKPEFISSLSKFYEGIVLAITGLGHVPTNLIQDKLSKSIIPEIKGLINSGIPVTVAPQTLYGRLNMNVYANQRILKDSGVIGQNADWTPETAFVKLKWTMGKTKNMEKVREIMMKNIAGEISTQTDPKTFLV